MNAMRSSWSNDLLTALVAALFFSGCGDRDLGDVHSPDSRAPVVPAASDAGGAADRVAVMPDAPLSPADASVAKDSGGPSDVARASAADVAPSARCRNPQPQVIGGVATGYTECDGLSHRPEKRDCPSRLPRPQMPHSPGPNVECNTDGDCTAKPHGLCQQWVNLGGTGYRCEYGCAKDEECAADEICRCGESIGRCVRAGCTTNATCAPGMLCASGADEGCNPLFACHTSADQCTTSRDCPGQNSYCAVLATGRSCRLGPADSSCR